jgi:hypothetical protein
MDPHVPVSLIGHSFGVRIATGALHLLAGGSLAGRVLPVGPPTRRSPARVVAISAAMDHHWLLPGRRHGLAMDLVDRMLVMYNPCDCVLKRYPLISESRSGHALGYTGLVGSSWLGEAAERIEQIRSTPWVGRSHSMQDHTRCTALMRPMARVALWQ